MRIENYQFPKSSFLSIEKDTAIIITKMLKNENLKKLLFYPIQNYKQMPNLTQEQTYSLINNQIRIVPSIPIFKEETSFVIITFNGFSNTSNPEFRDNIISFDIYCHTNLWLLGDFQLRPYKIAGEIDSMFNNKHLTGIGSLEFLGADTITLPSGDYAGLQLKYYAIHGEEDKV